MPLALSQNVIDLMYLVAAVGLILGIKGLSHPRTARYGNFAAAAGMTIAVAFTFASPGDRLLLADRRRDRGRRRDRSRCRRAR